MYIFNRILSKAFQLSLLIVLMCGCKQVKDDSCEAPHSSGDPSVVRLLVHFNLPKGLVPKTRAEVGTVTQGTDPMPNPTEDRGTDDERYLGKLRVFVFDGSGNLLVNKLFTGAPNGSAIDYDSNFEPVANQENTYEVRFRVVPGQGYRILTVANEPDEAHLDQVTDLNNLYHGDGSTGGANTTALVNAIESPADLAKSVADKHVGIPMVAEMSGKTVGQPGTKENPYHVDPTMELTRVLAKVDFYLRNTDGSGVLNPNAEDSQIEEWGITNYPNGVALFPEAHLTGGSLGAFTAPITHTAGDKYYDDNEVTGKYKLVGSAFLAERLSDDEGFDERSSTAVTLTTLSSGRSYVYSVPIINNRTATDKKRFDIHRNTIYKVYANLIGNEIRYKVLVRPWKETTIYKTISKPDLTETTPPPKKSDQ